MFRCTVMIAGILFAGWLNAQETNTPASHLHKGVAPQYQLDKEGLRRKLKAITVKLKKLALARRTEKEEVGRAIDQIIQDTGLLDLQGLGVSIIDEGENYHSTRVAVHHGANPKGRLWRMMADRPHEFVGLKLMPRNTVIALTGDVRAKELWKLWQAIMNGVIPGGKRELENFRSELEQMGVDLDALMGSLGRELALFVTMDPTTRKPLRGNPDLLIPSLSVVLAIKTRNDYLFEQVAKLAAKEKGVKRQKLTDLELLTGPVDPNATIFQQPTMASTKGWIFFATNPDVIKAAMRVQKGAPGLAKDEQFIRLTKGMPKRGNHMLYLSPELGKKNGKLIRAAVKKMVLPFTNLDDLAPVIKKIGNFHFYAVTVHHKDALVLHSRSSTRGVKTLYKDLATAADNTLKKTRAALEAADAPMKLADIIPPEIPDKDNAAVDIKAIIERFKTEEGDEQNLLSTLGNLAADILNEPPDPKKMKKFRELCRKKDALDLLARIEKAAGKTGYRNNLDWAKGPAILLPHLSHLRNVSRILAAKALFETSDNNHGAACKTVITSLKVADLAKKEPLLISQLVRMAQLNIAISSVHRLNVERCSPDQLKEIELLLKGFERMEPFIASIDGERLIFGDWAFRDEGKNLDELFASEGYLGMNPYKLFPPLFKMESAALLDIYRLQRQTALKPHSLEDMGLTEKSIKQLPPYCILTRMWTPSMGRSKTRAIEAIARARVARTGLAVVRYRLKHGSFPKELKEIRADSLNDPFTSEPLVYRRNPAGFVLYSVGQDLVDDQGKTLKNRKGDIVWKFVPPPISPTLKIDTKDLRILVATQNGDWFLAGGRAKEITVFNTKGITKKIDLPGRLHTATVSPDGKTAMISVEGGKVAAYSLTVAKPSAKVIRESGSSIRTMTYSPDGKRLVIGGIDRSLEIRDVASGKLLKKSKIKGTPRCLAVSPDGKTIACGVSSRNVFLLDATSLELKTTLTGHKFAVKCVDFSADGSQVLSASDDMTLRLWGTSGKMIHTFTGHLSLVTGASFLADGRRAVSISMDGSMRIWDLKTGKELRQSVISGNGLAALVMIEKGNGAVIAERSGTIYKVSERQLK